MRAAKNPPYRRVIPGKEDMSLSLFFFFLGGGGWGRRLNFFCFCFGLFGVGWFWVGLVWFCFFVVLWCFEAIIGFACFNNHVVFFLSF